MNYGQRFMTWVNLTQMTIISTTVGGQESLRRNGVAIMVTKEYESRRKKNALEKTY